MGWQHEIREVTIKRTIPAKDVNDPQPGPIRGPGPTAAQAHKYLSRLVLPVGRITLIPIYTSGNKIPLYAIPSISLSCGDFKTIACLLDEQQPFAVFQYPYWQDIASGSATIPEIAAIFAKALNDYQPQGPVAICGWSIGTIVALELAQQLKTAGRDVVLLIVIDWAPENTGIQSKRQGFLYSKGAWAYETWKTSNSASSFVRTLFKKLKDQLHPKSLDGNASEIALSEIVKDIPVIAGLNRLKKSFIFRLYEGACNYIPKFYTGDVLLFVASYSLHHRDEEKWAKLAPNLESIRLKGTHNTIVRWDDAKNLVDHLSRYMAKAGTRPGKSWGSDGWRAP